MICAMCFIAPIQPTFWTTKVTANIVVIAWYLWGCFCPWAALRDKADALLSDMETSFLVFCSVFLCQRFFFFFLGHFNTWRFRRRLRALANQVFSLNENNRNGSKVFLILSIIFVFTESVSNRLFGFTQFEDSFIMSPREKGRCCINWRAQG